MPLNSMRGRQIAINIRACVISRLTVVLLAVFGIFILGCSPKVRTSGGRMDDPLTHYKQGMKYWNDEKFDRAEEEFNLAKSLDKNFALAYCGLALVKAKTGYFDEALKLADKAQDLNSKTPEVFIAKALVIAIKNEGKEAKKWLSEVEKQFEKALKFSPDNAQIYYRRGQCYKNALDFDKASADFAKVLQLQKDFTAEADEQWRIVQMIQRAAPGTDVGKKIALVEKISRADIAALFVSELQIDKLVQKKRPKNYNIGFHAPADPRALSYESSILKPLVTDIEGHWAKNFIVDIVELDIRGLEPYPDHTFQPDRFITRGEYAMMVEDALIAILRDPSLATKHIGTQSRFADVDASHPAYNAICNLVDRGVMSAQMSGEFGLDKTVSGPEALLVIRNLKELNK